MANEFKPGHPIIFWLTMLALVFVFYTVAKAMVTIDDCRNSTGSDTKQWLVWPGEWECGKTGIALWSSD